MVSLGLVVLAGGVTVLGVALGVAPTAFRYHLRMAVGGSIDPALLMQVQDAFANTILTSLGVAVPVAMITAFAVTWIVARRLGRSVAVVADAADRIARGNLRVRVQAPAIGPEFTQLADAFNAMAARLADTETIRRRLIGDLAHEMRTPIASLEATVEAVVDGVLPLDAVTRATLIDQADRLRHLVADMSAVSRAEERQLDLHAEPVELGRLATDAVAAARARYVAAGVQLDLRITDRAAVVRVDPHRITEAVANLLDNALRHTPAGGAVHVVVATDPRGAVLEVVDTGSGFDPVDAERLFERFYRADASRTRSSAGSGIGLTIARAIVQAHGGTLTAASEGARTGARFRIRLPAHQHARARIAPK
ncbi:signal transduction histidine-protein kinase BaeS [mine drainage metagenome]|uniref:histidine kinase n=1 Tax=mine drainage metagenome TaxID=410659 RepID=A0A1J5R1X7_9ZZZZ